MGRGKKKAFSQQVVGAATTGLPSPVRNFLGSRVIAALIVLCLPILFVTGVVTVNWENGRPRLSINQEKAAEVEKVATEKLQDIRDEHIDDDGLGAQFVETFTGVQDPKPSFPMEWQQQREGFGDKIADGVEDFKGQFGDNFEPAPSQRQATKPFSKLRERIERLK